MKIIARNNDGIFLDSSLNEYSALEATPGLVVYQYLLSQFHLPRLDWDYDKSNPGTVLVEIHEEAEVMDSVLFDLLDYSNIAFPMKLFTFYLLGQLTGNSGWNQIGLVRGKKDNFIFFPSDMNTENLKNTQFELNKLGRFMLRKAKKDELKRAADSFFILLDSRLEERILNGLIQFHSETGIKADKGSYVDALFLTSRIKKLASFIYNQIG